MSVSSRGRLLIADDEYELMSALVELLSLEGYEAVGVTSGTQALEQLKKREFDILVTDLMMPGLDGMALLRKALEHDPYLVGVLMTGQGTVGTAVEAMKLGAFDYLLKPFKLASVLPMLERALQLRRVRQENLQLHQVVAIYDLSQTIASALDARTILEKTAEAAHHQTGADEVSILLLTPEGNELEVAALRGLSGRRDVAVGQRLPLEPGIAGWVARHQQPLILVGPVDDNRFQPVQPRPEIQAAISMPLLSAGRMVGVLNVNSLQPGIQFTPAHVRALSILASTAAAALQSAALFERSERLRRYNESILDTISEGLLLADHRGRITYINGGGLRLSGYSTDEVLGRNWTSFVPAAEHSQLRDQYAAQRSLGDGGVLLESRFLARDGREIPVLLSTTGFTQPGQPPGTLAVFTDITEQKRAQAELQLQAHLLNAMGLAVVGTDLELNINYWNAFAEKLYGWSAEEALGRSVKEVAHSEDARLLTPEIWAELSQGRTWSGEFRVERRDGSLVPTQAIQSPVYGPGGQLVGIIGVSMDITERKLAEEALRQERTLLRTLIDNIPDLIYTKDRERRFVLANRAAAASLGHLPDEIVGKTDDQLHPPETVAQFQMDEQSVIESGQPMVDREKLVIIGGQEQWLLTTSVPLRTSTGEVMGLVGISRNITERRQRERELEAISAVSAGLRTAQVRSEMVPVVLDELLGLLGAAGTALGSRDPASGERLVELARGAWAGITGHRLAAASELDAGVFANGQSFICSQAAADPRISLLLAGGQVSAIACLPLIADGHTTGVIWVGRGTPFTNGELRLLTAVTNIAANALHRVSLHEQVEQRLERLAALRAIDRAISASLDLRVALNVLLDQVMGQLGVDAAAVLLLDPHTRTLDYAARRGFRTGGERSRGGLTQDYAGRAVLDRRLIAIPDTAEASESHFKHAMASNDQARTANGPVGASLGELGGARAGDLVAAGMPGGLNGPHASLPAGEGFRAYFGAPLMAKGSVVGVLEVYNRTPIHALPEWLEFLDALAELAAIAIDNARLFDSLQHSNLNLTVAYDATIEGWSRALDLRDKETEGHTQRVTQLSVRLGRAQGLTEDELVHVRRGALLHDIGKMGVPDQILGKPGPLNDEEWGIMRRHPVYAYEMLSPIIYLHPALDIPYCHHEKWDGTGYPRGLAGEHIPLAARLFAVVDVWDALCSDRPYRAAWPPEKVTAHIRSLIGTHFDPQAVESFMALLETSPAG
jgi:PAS domain S-box-containing protein